MLGNNMCPGSTIIRRVLLFSSLTPSKMDTSWIDAHTAGDKYSDEIAILTPELISDVTGNDISQLSRLQILDLNLRGRAKGKIRKIENMICCPNLKQLSLSYNAITKIEGLDRLRGLVELNLAENAISKIENLTTLRALERLNLSGNQIQRIPESISQLQRLTNLRIARNELDVVRDLQNLSSLGSLTRLRIDENPFSSMEHTSSFAIYSVRSLIYLDGYEVSADQRVEAFRRFGPYEVALIELENQLAEEKQKLSNLKREVASPSKIAMQRMRSPGNFQLEDEESSKMIASKLKEMERCEAEIKRLERLIRDHSSRESVRRSEENVTAPTLMLPTVTWTEQGGEEHSLEEKPKQALHLKPTEPTPLKAADLHRPISNPNLTRIPEIPLRDLSSRAEASTIDHKTPERSTANFRRNDTSTPDSASSFRSPIVDIAAKQIGDLTARLERITSKLLQSEEEKEVLVEELRSSRRDSQESSRAIEANASLRSEVASLKDKLDSTAATLSQKNIELLKTTAERNNLNDELISERDLKQSLKGDLDSVRQDNESMQRQLVELKKALKEEERAHAEAVEVTRRKIQAASNTSVVDDWRQRETRLEIATQRVEMDSLKEMNSKLQRDLEESIRDTNQLGDSLLKCRQDYDNCRGRLNTADEATRKAREQLNIAESENRRFSSKIQELEVDIRRKDDENRELRTQVTSLKEDLDSMLKARGGSPTSVEKKLSPIQLQQLQLSSTRLSEWNSNIKPNRYSYLNAASTDSEGEGETEQKAVDQDREPFSLPTLQRRSAKPQGETKKSRRSMEGSLSELEVSAAESIGHMLLEEVSSNLSYGKSEDHLREACAKAALRLMCTSSSYKKKSISATSGQDQSSEERVDILPLQQLGDKGFLSKLVIDTQTGMAAIDEAKLMKLEVRQLEKIVQEMEGNISLLDQKLLSKEQNISALNKHCQDSKTKAQEAVNELEALTKKLQGVRDATEQAESEHSLMNREIDHSKHTLQESLALNELEQKNLTITRGRINDLKFEVSSLEDQVNKSREAVSKEEHKLRTTKSAVSDQLRLLQADLNKVQLDYKTQQKATLDLERHRRSVEEESELRKRDIENELSSMRNQMEDESRKLQEIRSDNRIVRLEVEQLVSRRRQLDAEQSALQERSRTENARLEAEEAEWRRRGATAERQLADAEKRFKEAKDKLAATEAEQILLSQSVEELRRQQADLERVLERRRRAVEEELAQSQQQAQLAIRTVRQSNQQSDQKRAELENITIELRTLERKCEEVRRTTREQELLLDTYREAAKASESDRERIRMETMTARKDDDEIRHKAQAMKVQLENDLKTLEETRRRLHSLQMEGVSLGESETKMKNSLTSLRKGITDAERELDELRISNEKERRVISDLKTQKTMLEGELGRLSEEIRFNTEQNLHGSMRKSEIEASLLSAREEMNRSQREVISLRKKVEESLRREEELRQQNQDLRRSQDLLKAEADGLTAVSSSEKMELQRLREECRELTLEMRRKKDDLQATNQEILNAQGGLEGLKAQRTHLEDIRVEIVTEIQRLRETSKAELKRTDRMEQVYSAVEERLKTLRTDIARTEATYERTRNMTAEEEMRVAEQRRALRAAMDELSNIEQTMTHMNKQMYEERQKALQEIGQLSQAKQSAQQHMFMLSETQQRLAAQTSGSSSSPAAMVQAQPRQTAYHPPPPASPSPRVKRGPPPIPTTHTVATRGNPTGSKTFAGEINRREITESQSFGPSLRLPPEERVPSSSSSSSSYTSQLLQQSRPHPNATASATGDVELSEIQREVERLRRQSAAILQSTAQLSGP